MSVSPEIKYKLMIVNGNNVLAKQVPCTTPQQGWQERHHLVINIDSSKYRAKDSKIIMMTITQNESFVMLLS